MYRKSKIIIALVFFPALLLLYGNTNSAYENSKLDNPIVYRIKIDGSINPATSDYVHKGLQEAETNHAVCLVIELNTPGGLLKSTRYIVTDLLTSDIPVIVYVAPSGAQCASAGVFIALAANIAAMAPGTNIGASHPVTMEGTMDSVMSEKATNDAAAFIRSISEKRNRNTKWAEDAVRKSVSISENEALKLNVIDLIADNTEELLQKVDGKEIETAKGKVILNTKNARVVDYEMSWFEKFLAIVSDPNIGYILMMLGIWGIILEFYHPGGILPGVVGVICLVLGLYGLHTLPINYAGFALILLAIILFIAEIKIVSHGLLTVGGVISLLLGSFMLIDTGSSLEGVKLSMTVIFTTVFIISLLFIILILLVIKAHKRKVVTGSQGLVGEIGEVVDEITTDKPGIIKLHGELWNAESDRTLNENIQPGAKVRVVSVSNLKLSVQKI
jgi:membrane-bound serine protease (ClpP class)